MKEGLISGNGSLSIHQSSLTPWRLHCDNPCTWSVTLDVQSSYVALHLDLASDWVTLRQVWCLTTKTRGWKSEGFINWLPGVAASFAAMDLPLWENLTWLDPEDLSNPLSGQHRRDSHVSWQGALQSEIDSWTDGSSEIHSGRMIDLEIIFVLPLSRLSGSAIPWSFSKSTQVLQQKVSCKCKHVDSQSEVAAVPSFNIVVMKKETGSSPNDSHDIDGHNRNCSPFLPMPSILSPGRMFLFHIQTSQEKAERKVLLCHCLIHKGPTRGCGIFSCSPKN